MMDSSTRLADADTRLPNSAPIGLLVRVGLITGLIVGSAILVIVIIIVAGSSALYSSIHDLPCFTTERLKQYSGYTVPTSSTIVHCTYKRNSFNGNGHFACIFDISPKEVETLIGSPCWDSPWRAGPPEPKANRLFDDRFRNDPVWTDTSVLYVVEDRVPTGIPWHNARIMIVNTETGRVWFGEYDI